MLSPFPVVRIKGRLPARGARVTLLSVAAPRGATISVSCTGTGCPTSRFARVAGTGRTRLGAFERSLRAGTHITVLVSREGYIGKRTVIVIRKGSAPARRDSCLSRNGKAMTCRGS